MPFHVGDTKPDLSGALASDGTPTNLTGATLAVHVKQPDKAVLTIATTGGADGSWSAPWPAPIAQAGLHHVEVQVTWSGGGVQTFGPSTFYVNEAIA